MNGEGFKGGAIPDGTGGSPKDGMHSVLIADHSPAMRKNMAEMMTAMSLRVCGLAETGQEAVRMSRQFRPNLVLLDIVMAGLPGIETLGEIRRMLPATKIIILTSVSERDQVMDCKRMGAADYVLKPFDWDFLRARIAKVIERVKLEQDALSGEHEPRFGLMKEADDKGKVRVGRCCSGCGKMNRVEHSFCGYCGRSLEAIEAPTAAGKSRPVEEGKQTAFYRQIMADARKDKSLFFQAQTILRQEEIEELFDEDDPIE